MTAFSASRRDSHKSVMQQHPHQLQQSPFFLTTLQVLGISMDLLCQGASSPHRLEQTRCQGNVAASTAAEQSHLSCGCGLCRLLLLGITPVTALLAVKALHCVVGAGRATTHAVCKPAMTKAVCGANTTTLLTPGVALKSMRLLT